MPGRIANCWKVQWRFYPCRLVSNVSVEASGYGPGTDSYN